MINPLFKDMGFTEINTHIISTNFLCTVIILVLNSEVIAFEKNLLCDFD